MNNILEIILYSFFAGITIFVGGLLSKCFEEYKNHPVKEKITHSFIAFGGGILIAAVGLVLVPEGMKHLSVVPLSVIFILGGLCFFCIDMFIEKKGGKAAQLMAMLMDFVPEALALGAVFAKDHKLGLLLAIFIGLQNLPESFNAYIDLRQTGYSSKKALSFLFPLSFIGIVAALCGDFFLSSNPTLTASIMIFSSGGIVYLMFQDIAPMSKLKNMWSPALGATIGFLVGIIGNKILG